jgi:hypothetical protein
MRQNRFDELTKTLASDVSRRNVVKTLALGAIAGIFGVLKPDKTIQAAGPTPAASSKKCTNCQSSQTCCNGVCVNTSTDA